MADDALLTFDQYGTNRVTFEWSDDDGIQIVPDSAKLQIRRRPGYPVLYEAYDGGDLAIDVSGDVNLVIPDSEFADALWTWARWDILLTAAAESDVVARGRVRLVKGITTPDTGS